MKVTKSYLKQVIKEELDATVKEVEYSGAKALPRDIAPGATASGDELANILKQAYYFCMDVAAPHPDGPSKEAMQKRAMQVAREIDTAREIIFGDKIRSLASSGRLG
jgi:ribosomal protein S6